jgi:3-hydroxybutyryl-CoA dehydrogenase
MTERLLIVGGGTMGSGIALAGAAGGYDVEVVEPSAVARERASSSLESEAQRLGDPSLVERIRWSETIAAPCDAPIAIEAVPERFDLKREVLEKLARALAPGSLIATNTSSLSVAELAETIPDPQRVIGLHFFNPPTRMPLLEVVGAPETGEDALESAFEFAARIGKTAVLASDTPGFIVNRVARPYYLQALRTLERGAASAEELDALARAAGFRMGPFELMDLIGLDVNLATSESIYERTGAPRFEPVALQRAMVAQGRLGRKSGEGFYSYAGGRAARFEIAVPEPAGERNADEVVTILGFGARADELAELVQQRFAHVARIENDDFLESLDERTTIIVDAGDGANDRGEIVAELDARLGPESVLFVDAYATDLSACARHLRHSERVVGYGLLGSLDSQRAIEIVDAESVSDDALELAQDFFGTIGKGVVLVEDVPGLFLGGVVGSIVNEAMTAVAEDVASSEDIDTAMQLGAGYPLGPVAWGREIGGARLDRILKRLAHAQGEGFAPHRSLWLLDVAEEPASAETLE